MNCIICGREIKKSSYTNAILCSSECFGINFWNKYVQIKDDPQVVRINGEHFYIQDENSKSIFRGHGGTKFKIRFFDGREITTTNLWCQGDIPEDYKDLLPDNAEFIKE